MRTDPDSSMVNPAHIHITSAPQIRNEKVLKMNWDSSLTAAWAPTVPHNRKPTTATTVRTLLLSRTQRRRRSFRNSRMCSLLYREYCASHDSRRVSSQDAWTVD